MRFSGRIAAMLGGIALVVVSLALSNCHPREEPDLGGPIAEWPHWGGAEGGARFSALTQITPQNVEALEVAWTYRTGAPPRQRGRPVWAFEVTPIVAEGRMYLCTPLNEVVALDPETGRELWSYDPKIDWNRVTSLFNCRGVTFYRDEPGSGDSECAAQIFLGTLDARLISLDAASGKPCQAFGLGGTVNLLNGLGRVHNGEYSVTSPPVVAARRVIIGAHILDNAGTDVPAGVIRAFDVDSGALSWAWNPLPPGRTDAQLAPAGETYARGTPNAWAPFSVDRDRGLIFIPTGNPANDLYGGDRDGFDYYGSSVVALHAASGQVAWHFQTVHHDLWDYDVPAQPVLIDFPTPAGRAPALVQATKQGNIYILNRETGEPLVPVVERAVSQKGMVDGETPSPTQPFPANPAYVLHRNDLKSEAMWGFTFWDKEKCREKTRTLLNEGIYTLTSQQGSLISPAPAGVMNWGGLAVDTSRDILIVNTTHIASIQQAIPVRRPERSTGSKLKMEGGSSAYTFYSQGSPYEFRVEMLLSPLGAPCNPPPWGALTAIDLKAGNRLWEIPLGSTRDQAPFPFWLNLGVPALGGPIVTASGLTFIAATTDNFLRAFDSATGEQLWKARLPAGGQAIPMTYRLRPDGKQYVVIAAGGHEGMGTALGDYIIAYALKGGTPAWSMPSLSGSLSRSEPSGRARQ